MEKNAIKKFRILRRNLRIPGRKIAWRFWFTLTFFFEGLNLQCHRKDRPGFYLALDGKGSSVGLDDSLGNS